MMTGFGMGFGWLFMGIFWVAIIAMAIWFLATLFPAIGNKQSDNASSESALDIVQKRYARGELTREEFDAIRQEIAA